MIDWRAMKCLLLLCLCAFEELLVLVVVVGKSPKSEFLSIQSECCATAAAVAVRQINSFKSANVECLCQSVSLCVRLQQQLLFWCLKNGKCVCVCVLPWCGDKAVLQNCCCRSLLLKSLPVPTNTHTLGDVLPNIAANEMMRACQINYGPVRRGKREGAGSTRLQWK